MKNKRIKYIDRTVLITGMHIGLCVNEKQFKNELNRLKIKDNIDYCKVVDGATTHFFQIKKEDKNIAIVCMNVSKKSSLIESHALIVHELYHIWKYVLKDLDERNPGEEMECYGLQNLFLSLADAYDKMTKKATK